MNKRICVGILLMVAAMAGGCVTSAPPAPDSAAALPAAATQAELQESLFKEDQNVMSNPDMERVLTSRVTLPAEGKVAVIRFGQMPYWWGWSEDFVRMNQKIDADFLAKLASARRVKKVSYLPSLVTPREMTIPYLRQAAARFQADLMLIYRTSTRTFDKERFIGRDESRAYCTVEAVLVDTRSGIIPFSTVATEMYSTKRASGDLEFSEMVARAQQQAIASAWMKLAEATVNYLDSLPALAAGSP